MTWEPSGAWKAKFRAALIVAFDDESFTLLLSDYFTLSFANISPPFRELPNRLHVVIEKARMEGWLLDLISAAYERRPKNPVLAGIAEELGFTLTGPRLLNTTGKPLQEVIRDNAKFINPVAFVELLPQLQGQVCWVDIPGGGGTGFLVGADLVLTNQHVVQRIEEGEASPQDVRCHFDYRKAVDGTEPTLKKRVLAELAPAWRVDAKPPSRFDWNPVLGDASENESDFALLRLAEPIGDLPVGGDTIDSKVQPRGWIDTSADVPPLAKGNQVFLLQHPRGEPLQLTVGTVVEFNQAGTRVRYDANSKEGSSGSPVFDADLRLVALHHSRDPAEPPKWNQAIPFGVVKKVWNKP